MNDRYLRYLMAKVDTPSKYTRLLKFLSQLEFRWDFTLLSDNGRADDGIALRGLYFNESRELPFDYNRDTPCTVLEMLVAFSIRIETDLMGEPDNDHPDRWFWEMIDNLGLSGQTNDRFDQQFVIDTIGTWMSRDFKRNGDGGLFPLSHPRKDQRKASYWEQMGSYINERY